MGFGQTSLSGVRRGFMPPQLKTKTKQESMGVWHSQFKIPNADISLPYSLACVYMGVMGVKHPQNG
jgi:hypothetical protein